MWLARAVTLLRPPTLQIHVFDTQRPGDAVATIAVTPARGASYQGQRGRLGVLAGYHADARCVNSLHAR